jgi:hypothetical protein
MHLSLPEPYTGPVSFKMEFGDYEISVAFDALDRLDNCLPKCSICVFKNIENVTEDLFEVEEILCADEEILFSVIQVVTGLNETRSKTRIKQRKRIMDEN